MVWRKTTTIENTVNRLKRVVPAGTLIIWLLIGATTPEAAYALQDDPAGQCAEGVRLFQDGETAAALPLLSAGFARREREGGSTNDDLGVCALMMGRLRQNMGDYRGALEAYTVALEIFRRNGNQTYEGATLNNIGLVYDSQGRYTEALEIYRQALVLAQNLGNRAGEGITLNNIGAIYTVQGRYAEALDTYKRALAAVRSVDEWPGEFGARPENTILIAIGAVYQAQGSYSDALATYQQVLTRVRQVDDRLGESQLLNNIGTVYDVQGRYAEALEAFQHALAIVQLIGNRYAEGITFSNIGSIYYDQGRYAEALDAYFRAMEILREIGDQRGEGTTYNNIGLIYYAQEHYAEALEAFKQALTIRHEMGDRPGESNSLNNIGLIYAKQGRSTEALAAFQETLVMVRAMGNRYGESHTLNNIGGVYADQRRAAPALDAYKQALAIHQEVGDHLGEGNTLINIGVLYQDEGDIDQALTHYARAMDVLENVRSVAGSEQGRAGFISKYAWLYQRAALLYHQQGQDDLAFLTAERGRARAFLDSLATGEVQLRDQEDTALLAREQDAYAARQTAQEALAKARSAWPLDSALIAALELQLKSAEDQLAQARAAIEMRGGQLAALVPGRTRQVLDRTTVQKLLAPQTTLISFFVGQQQTLAFVLTRDRFQAEVLPLGRDVLHDQIQALLDNPTFQQQAHPIEGFVLYTALIAPLKPYLTTSHLAIIPHGPLHYLPWAALSDGQRSLINDYVVTTLPSASVLPFIKANSGRPFAPPLVLGNPDGTLSFAEQEARAVASLYGVQPLIGDRATKSALQTQASQAGILHLAAHGTYNPTSPLASSITLAPTVTSTVRLEASEVYALDLHKADLVVLSACQTNLGDVSAGDEVVGLTRAFFFAGTPTVVSSLWNVDDAATNLLMERFYTHLRAGMGKAEALRQAQMDVRAQYPAPYYWAGFVLSGDAGTLPTEIGWRWLVLGGLLAMVMVGLAGALLWLQRRLGPVS